jgi:uncharacterized membrane protein
LVLRGLLVLGGLSPILVWLLERSIVLAPLARPFHAWFDFQCHRDPARSLAWFDIALPVCTRCLGIYVGLAMGALLLLPVLKPAHLRWWVAVAAALLVLDVASVALALRPSLSSFRFLTGLAVSYPVGVTLGRIFNGSFDP